MKTKLIALLILAATLGGCRSVKTAQVSVVHDTVRVFHVKHFRDSVFIDRYHTEKEQGDTVLIRDSVFGYRWKYLTQTDTLYISKNASDTIIQTETKTVKERSGYDRFVSWGFWILVVIFLLITFWKIFCYIRKKP